MRHTNAKKKIVFLKFRLNSCPVFYLATLDKSRPPILTDLEVLRDGGMLE